MMSYEDFVLKAEEINARHQQDRESKSHIDDLMRLYKEYGNAENAKDKSDFGEQSRSVSGDSGE